MTKINRGVRGLLLISALSMSMAACTSLGSPSQLAEKADTDAQLAYAAIATSVNTYEQRPGVTAAQVAGAENIKIQGWKALIIERQAYKAGKAIDLTALVTLVTQAKALLGGK